MPLSIKDGGVWKVATPHVKDAGTWKAVLQGFVRDAGVWKEFWSAAQVYLENTLTVSLAFAPDTSFAQFRLQSDGVASTESFNAPGFAPRFTWLLSGSAGDYEARMTMVSGPNFTGSALGSWLPLSGPQTWTTTRNMNGQSISVGTLEIRRAIDSVVLATATITNDVTREP